MREKLKKILSFTTNPRLLLCLFLAWCITNGWSYILFALGTVWEIGWMTAISGAYLAFLWLPVSPEKIVTVAIAIVLLRWWFPDDTKTLAVLRELAKRAKKTVGDKKQVRKKKKENHTGDPPDSHTI